MKKTATTRRQFIGHAAKFLFAAPALGAGRAPVQQNKTTIISIPQEVQLGREAAAQIRAQSKIITSGPEYERLARVRKQLLPTLKAQYKTENDVDIDFNITLIDSKEVNAFALPSGDLFVYTGLVKSTKNDAELAGVLGHEGTHTVRRHFAKLIDKQQKMNTIASIILGVTKANNSQVLATQVGLLLQQLNYSRDMESEADRQGQANMLAVGYNPKAMADFFETMKKNSNDKGPTWLSNHPGLDQRIKEARQWAAANTISVEDPFGQSAPTSAPTPKQIFGVP